MEPRAHIKRPSVFRRVKLDLLYLNLVGAINTMNRKEFQKVDAIAMTCDGWRGNCGHKFITYTLHYINKDFLLRRVTVQTSHVKWLSHTRDLIAGHMDHTINGITGLPENMPVHMVTDGATNYVGGARQADRVKSNHTCVDHAVNNACKGSFNEATNPFLHNLIKKMQGAEWGVAPRRDPGEADNVC